MLGSLLITLREGIEAALIVSIILTYLGRTGSRHAFKFVWLGTALAILASLVAGFVIYVMSINFSGQTEEIFEGSAMLLAAGILTWMIFWMRAQAVNIRDRLHTQIQGVLDKGSSLGLVALAFVVVVREGIETTLFLFAASRIAGSPLLFTAGGILGLVLAVGVGYSVYKSTSRLNLRHFFNVTSVVLILFAAGLLAHGIHEFQEVDVIPALVEHVWDINHIIAEDSTYGQFLTAIFGYNANPSLVEVTAYLGYFSAALALYFYPFLAKRRGARKTE